MDGLRSFLEVKERSGRWDLISDQGNWPDGCVTHPARGPVGGPDVWGLDQGLSGTYSI